jgi:hypothetical protein
VTPEQPLRYTLQELWERRVGDSLVTLALAAKLTDSEKYRDKLHDMVIAACGYETWGRAFPGIDANMDLAAGSVIRGVAMAWDWHRDAFSPEEQAYIVDVVRSRGNSLLSGLYGKAYWASRFTENHNHVSVAGLGLAGLSFYRDIPEAGEWLAGALLNFQRAFELASPDGSSDEGVPYWTYGLTSILQFVEGTKKITDADEFRRLAVSCLGEMLPIEITMDRNIYFIVSLPNTGTSKHSMSPITFLLSRAGVRTL